MFDLVPRCQVSRCQSQQFWWSRDVQFRVFSRPVSPHSACAMRLFKYRSWRK